MRFSWGFGSHLEYISLHRLHQLDILFGILTEHVAAGCVPQTGYLRKHPPSPGILVGYQVRYSSRQCPPKRLKGQERGRRQVNHHRLDHEMDLHLVSIGWPLGDAFGEHWVPISGDVCYQPGLLCVCSAFTHPTAHSKPLFGPFFAHRLSPYLPTKYVFPSPILNASQRPPLILGSKSSARLTKWQQSPFHSNFGPISHSRMPPCDWCMSGALPTLKSKYSHPPPLPNLNLIFFSVIQAPGHTVVYLMQLDAI